MSKQCLFHKHVSEVVGRSKLSAKAKANLVHKTGDPIVLGTEVILRLPRSDRGVKRGARPHKDGQAKAGRPPLYKSEDRLVMRSALNDHGLTGAQKWLTKNANLTVSLTTLRSVATEFGIGFKRGRPVAA